MYPREHLRRAWGLGTRTTSCSANYGAQNEFVGLRFRVEGLV
jgi:hypothetical protein